MLELLLLLLVVFRYRYGDISSRVDVERESKLNLVLGESSLSRATGFAFYECAVV